MNFKVNYRVYEKENLLVVSEERLNPIVQDFLYEKDYILLIAREKTGKSILAMQLACAISSGENFLGTLEITKPTRVWYFATEGKDDDTKDRLIRMSHKVKINTDNLKLICSPGLRLNTNEGRGAMKELISKYKDELPNVMIIDPMYSAIKGSIRDDDIVNEFTYIVRFFADVCGASVIVVHHSKRDIRLQDGSVLELGDDAIFGSTFLKASVDHVFYMGKVARSENKFLRCDTQRSGNIIDSMELKLHEPDPLYFELVEKINGIADEIKKLLEGGKRLSVKQLAKYIRVSRVSIYSNIKGIEGLKKELSRPVLYYL